MKIDVFPHIIPHKYRETLYRKIPANAFPRRLIEVFGLSDLEQRFRIMDRYPDYVQILTLGAPFIESIVGPEDSVELARIANDGMAELVAKYADRFVSAVASLPMNNVDAALKEVERAIEGLHLRGIQLSSDINGKPLDSSEFLPLFEMMAKYDLPILLHPDIVPNSVPDYPGEEESRYLIHLIFQWPYRTTCAMTRLAMSGIFERFPNLKIITHHCGAMVPFFKNRIETCYASYEKLLNTSYPHLIQEPLDYFHRFYADTAVNGSSMALMCGYEFFGVDHMLFATDMPYDAQQGDIYVGETIQAVAKMKIPSGDKRKIFSENARKLFKLA